MEKEKKPGDKRTKYLRLGYNPNPRTNPKVKKPKPEEGHVRCCEECGEGPCCDGREKKPRIVGIDYTRD